jgi:hypothetical protein
MRTCHRQGLGRCSDQPQRRQILLGQLRRNVAGEERALCGVEGGWVEGGETMVSVHAAYHDEVLGSLCLCAR